MLNLYLYQEVPGARTTGTRASALSCGGHDFDGY